MGVMAVALLVPVALCIQAQAAGIMDEEIAMAVQSELMLEKGIAPHFIDVGAKDGIVTLNGSVSNILARERAAQAAETIRGVRSVVNNIRITPVVRSDDEIGVEVLKVLRNHPAISLEQATVDVKSGVVTLRGKADSRVEWRLSMDLTKGVPGVTEVRNRLAYEPRALRSDEEIEREIWARLVWDVWVDESLVRVNVKDGHVTLGGLVGSGRERWRAYQDAWIVGVKSVNHKDLKVEERLRPVMRREPVFSQRGDEEIEEAMRTAIGLDPKLARSDIKVNADYGIVTLTGVVDNFEDRQRAEHEALHTTGVWRVRNHLSVQPMIAPVGYLGMNTPPYLYTHDLTEKVEIAFLLDPDVDQHEISVYVDTARTVTLEGKVDSQAEKTKAGDLAAAVKGVMGVVNNIQVGGTWAKKSDPDIHRDIRREIWWSPYVSNDDVTVFVNDGVVTLTGVVDTLGEKRAATENAYDAGARKVRNYLRVNQGPDYYRPIFSRSEEHNV